VTLEGSGALLHDGVLLKRSNHFPIGMHSRKEDPYWSIDLDIFLGDL